MVVIREFNDDKANKETTFDVTRFTYFLEKDNSFLTPWSWKPNTSKNDTNSSTKEKKEKQYNYFHPESYFSYQERRNNAQIFHYNPYWSFERLYPQVIWYPVLVTSYNQAPTYVMFPTN
ncbi:unnamed protein product [Trifolium pratense]|uniref:Uncharacterized protein n=1 Tax=Trifolium pratense TaxID=57577 RepID=A0ACB0LE17_TRIPR|nr:unnamed protein product [Trifolium pratense]